ncbi:MAG: pyruvate kinase [Nitrospirae bacterium]|nr:pyruvate kinase [Nitrospirota bacterium]
MKGFSFAKIVCTIGPASYSQSILKRMIREGMNVARLNFSHGSHEDHAMMFSTIHETAKLVEKPVAVLEDLQGIKIRVTDVLNGAVKLRNGQKVLIKQGEAITTDRVIYISYPALLRDVKKGQRILIDDGVIVLTVVKKGRDYLEARVKEAGVLKSRKGVNLPESKISLKPFTDKDRADLEFGLSLGIDYVAMSFVMRASEIKQIKRWLSEKGQNIPVIAKIERPEALNDISEIIRVSDGIMVARGDLGVEIPPEEVPIIQKDLVRMANEEGKVVIIATQMLESMREHTRPTRAEATDVANAVFDGADALMLSAETSTGQYPVEAVRMMKRIIRSAEKRYLTYEQLSHLHISRVRPESRISFAVADAAVRAAQDLKAKCIVAFTRSGYTALLVSKCRPRVPIVAFTPEEKVMRLMSLYWGVRPFLTRQFEGTDEMIKEVDAALSKHSIAKKGDVVVIISGSPVVGKKGKTDLLKVHRIGDDI